MTSGIRNAEPIGSHGTIMDPVEHGVEGGWGDQERRVTLTFPRNSNSSTRWIDSA